MFSRLGAQFHGWLAAANTALAAGKATTPLRTECAPSGRHPIAIALDVCPDGSPWRQCVFGVFGALPDHVLEHIAHYVSDEEFVNWSRTCRQAFAVLRPEQLWRQLPAAVAGVVSLAMMRGAVRDIGQWAMPRARHWLAALALRLPLLEHGSVQQGFAILLDAAQRLPPGQRGAVLEALAAARGRCAVPDAPCRIGLALERRLYEAAWLLAQAGSERPFCVVVSHASYDLAQSQSPADWDATIGGLPEPCRVHALVAVQARLDRIWAAATNEKAWTDRLRLASALPAVDRDLGLIALALPNAHLQGTHAQRRFETMLPLAPSLAAGQRPGFYSALACLAMALPSQLVRPAWSRLMDAVPALGALGAGQLAPYLYGALACLPQADQHACGQALEQYLQSAMLDLPAVAADITRAPHAGRHWELALAVRGTQYWISLPQELGATVVQFLRAQRAVVPAAPLTPERAARMPAALHARALEYRAATLQNLSNGPGFSFDADDTDWNALLDRIAALPQEVQRAPLAALGSAVAKSVPLYTARLLLASFGLPAQGPDPVSQAWEKVVIAAQRLPVADQIDLATRFAPHIESRAALRWIFDVVRRAPAMRRSEMLLGLARNSVQFGSVWRASLWASVFEQALTLPRLARWRVLACLKEVFPPEGAPGWDRAMARKRLTQGLETLEAGS